MRLWIPVSILAAGGAGGVIAWVVMGLLCRPAGCPGTRVLVTAGAALGAMAGVGVVVVLAVLSLEEWRRR